MNPFNFESLSNMIQNDEFKDELSGLVRDNWLEYFKNESSAKLPQVCEPGKECRDAIVEEAHLKLKEDWDLTLKEIQLTFTSAIRDTKTILE